MADHPVLSIGLPVYNGANYLRDAIDSLVAQTFRDFEVIIGDNASTDDTARIAKEYMRTDRRIRYHRQSHNLGAAPNFNDVYRRANGQKYFKWASHDDLLEPTFLASCIEALESHPECPLAYSLFWRIDGSGDHVAEGEPRPELGSDEPAVRAASAIYPYEQGGASDSPIFGVIRRTALERTRLHGSFTGSDRTLVLELALQGPFYEVPEPLFSNRDHPDRSTRIYTRAKKRQGHVREGWFDTKREGRIVYPAWRRMGEHSTAVLRAGLAPADLLKTLGVLARWVVSWNWKRLAYDVVVAWRQFSSGWRTREGPDDMPSDV